VKIIRLTEDVLEHPKDEIRYMYDLDSKDSDSEIYRILVPIVKDTHYLSNLVNAFVESNLSIPFTDKYTFHCANHDIVNSIYTGITQKGIKEYREFQLPIILETV